MKLMEKHISLFKVTLNHICITSEILSQPLLLLIVTKNVSIMILAIYN